MRRYDEFAADVDGHGAIAYAQPVVAPLRALAEGLQALPLGPSPEFRDALRQRLIAVAGVSLGVPAPATDAGVRARTWAASWRVQQTVAVGAASMVAVVGFAAVGTAASRSLPGDPFYGVKRRAEGVQVAFSRNDVTEGKRHLQHAETRLAEIAELGDTSVAFAPITSGNAVTTVAFGGSTAQRVVGALRAMDESTRDGTRLLTAAYLRRSAEKAPLAALSAFAQRQRGRLGRVVGALPIDTRDEVAQSIGVLTAVQKRADELLTYGACGAACAPAPVTAPTPDQPSAGPDPAPSPLESATAEPEPTEAPPTSPEPEPSPTPSPTPAPSPSPTPSASPTHGSHLPSQVPAPVRSVLDPVVETVESRLPFPLPTITLRPPG